MLNMDDVQVGVAEMERCARIGLAGVMVPVYPPEGRAYDSPEYEPLWAAAQDLELPIGLHTGLIRMGPGETMDKLMTPSYHVNRDHWARVSLTDMIASGVFERYPKLQVGSVGGGGILGNLLPRALGLRLHGKDTRGRLATVQERHASQRLLPS